MRIPPRLSRRCRKRRGCRRRGLRGGSCGGWRQQVMLAGARRVCQPAWICDDGGLRQARCPAIAARWLLVAPVLAGGHDERGAGRPGQGRRLGRDWSTHSGSSFEAEGASPLRAEAADSPTDQGAPCLLREDQQSVFDLLRSVDLEHTIASKASRAEDCGRCAKAGVGACETGRDKGAGLSGPSDKERVYPVRQREGTSSIARLRPRVCSCRACGAADARGSASITRFGARRRSVRSRRISAGLPPLTRRQSEEACRRRHPSGSLAASS